MNHARKFAVLGGATVSLAVCVTVSLAQSPGNSGISPVNKVTARDGAAIFATLCQGCHMPGGKGAAGAGHYPALAGNAKLEASDYPVHVVVNGQKAMPGFGAMLDDEQVLAVVNYIRANLGNNYTDPTRAAHVEAAR